MRNIKTTLRYVRNSALLFAAASGMSYLTACQSENDITTPDNPDIPESTLKTASYSVYGPNQNRIRNYGTRSTRDGEKTTAAESIIMPAIEDVLAEANAVTLKSSSLEYTWEVEGKHSCESMVIDNEFGRFRMSGKYYVTGTLDFSTGFDGFGDSVIEGGPVIYVLEDATFKLGGTLPTGLTVYNYGNLEISNGLDIAGTLYSKEGVIAGKNIQVEKGGKLFCKETISAHNLQIEGEAICCGFVADGNVIFNEEGTFRTSYIKGTTVSFNKGNVVLDDNGLVVADELFLSNEDTRFTVDGTNAVVSAKKFVTNNLTWPKKQFAAEIALNFDECYVKDVKYPHNDFEFQVSNPNQVIYVPSAGCHGEFGTPGEPTIEIKKVTDIDGHDHDHGIISATCINFGEANNTAYVSYHLRGNGDGEKNENYVGNAQRGCIEVIKDNGEAGLELGSYMIAPDWDFNHLIVDEDRIVTVGNSKTMSAFIGTLPVDFEASTGIDRKVFEVKELTTNEPIYGPSKDDPNTQIRIGFKNAGDGNCVVRKDNYYYVATYGGYGPLNLDFTRVNDADGNKIFTKTNGSAKHISLNRNGKMAVLAHDTYDKPSSTASVFIYDASDFAFANKINTFDAVGTIEPVDGKNVIAMDGDQVYACLSKGGLVRVNDGKKWQRHDKNNIPVNGMAFDDKYIYVANGSFVSVLDKATMEEICYYHASSKKSANYIALHNDKIYVAFGEDGLQVFELTEKTISE